MVDARGNIYMAPEVEIPVEDKARLDGYLRGRAEATALLAKKLEGLERLVEERAARGQHSAG